MQNPFNHFSKKYCINLDCRQDRWNTTTRLIEEYKIENVERFKGVEVSKEQFDVDKKQLAQLGCALSFYSILDGSRDLDSVLILEDDICFNYDLYTTYQTLRCSLSELPEDWDLFYLGNNLNTQYANNPVSRFSPNLFRVHCSYATHAMGFSKLGINKFLDFFGSKEGFINAILSEYKAVDVFVAKEFLNIAKCFIGSKMLVGQRDDFSNIENSRCRYNEDFINRFKFFTSNL